MGASNRHGKKMWRLVTELYHYQCGRCGICGESMEEEFRLYLNWVGARSGIFEGPAASRKKIGINIDHIVPKAHGGNNLKSNLRLTHSLCNYARGAPIPDEPTEPFSF